MQLTDAEIREILIREKRKKKRRKMRQRRIAILLIFLLIILGVGIKIFLDKTSGDKSSGKVTTAAEQSDSEDSEESQEKDPEVPVRGTIFIDAGHGGSDPGSEYEDRSEKEDTLEFAIDVKYCLEAAGFKVVMSREDDIDVERSERCNMANKANSQLMISFHRNKAQGDNTGEGVEAYIPSFDNGNSRQLAQNILDALEAQGFTERTITKGEYKNETSDYDELANITMPACLIEVGFINSTHDNELFDKNFENNAQAVTNAIEATFKALFESEDEESTNSN